MGIAQALVSNPEILILDEPTVGLDPKQVAEIRHLLQELRGQHTIVLSTHILPEVQAICERIIIINKGKIVAQDSLQNLANLQNSMQSGARRVNLRVRRGENIAQSLSSVAGVKSVEAGVSQQDWTLHTTDSEDVIERVASEVIQKGYGLLEISSARADLEDVFLKLTYGQETKPEGGLVHG